MAYRLYVKGHQVLFSTLLYRISTNNVHSLSFNFEGQKINLSCALIDGCCLISESFFFNLHPLYNVRTLPTYTMQFHSLEVLNGRYLTEAHAVIYS